MIFNQGNTRYNNIQSRMAISVTITKPRLISTLSNNINHVNNSCNNVTSLYIS